MFRRDQSERLPDSWGHPLAIEPTEHGEFCKIKVTSAGRDCRFGTADDFSRELTFNLNAALEHQRCDYKPAQGNALGKSERTSQP